MNLQTNCFKLSLSIYHYISVIRVAGPTGAAGRVGKLKFDRSEDLLSVVSF